MQYTNFDKIIPRHGTYSAKWNKNDKSIIPLSVADMDISAPDFIINAMKEFANKGIYGYTILSDNWNQVTANWFKRHHNWQIQPEHIVFCPRVIQAVSLYIQNYTHVGDKITTLSPAYQPISQSVFVNQRELLESKLIYSNEKYFIDFDDLEEKFSQSVCFILLSPHNPTGTVWSKADLIKIGQLAEKHNVFIISDDVHSDFIFGENSYYPISSLSQFVEHNSFICTSPAKTFNMAGLEVANIVIANTKYREKFSNCLIAAGIHNPGYFSVPAFLAAYTHGDEWLSELKQYLQNNRDWVIKSCNEYFPEWKVTHSYGTYMLWINYQKMNITEQQLKHWFVDLAGIEMSFGSGFGLSGDGFFRINIATPFPLLKEAFERLIHTCPYHSKEPY